MKILKLFMVLAIITGAVAYLRAVEGAGTSAAPGQSKKDEVTELQNMPFEALINKTKSIKDRDEKNKYASVIRKRLPTTEPEKQAIIKFLESDNADDKGIALEILARIKEKRAVPAIIKELKSKDYRVWVMAIGALVEIGDERAITPLLENPDSMILEFGQCPLAKFGAPALPKLVDVAKKSSLLDIVSKKQHKDRKSRNATSCIEQIRDEKAVPALMKLLKDDDADVRLGAVVALSSMKVKAAEPEFERMLQDSNENVRMSTLRALANADKPKYLPKVSEAIQEKRGYEKGHAIELLGELGTKEYLPMLEGLLKDTDEYRRHDAAFALWKITGKVYPYEKGRDTLHSEQFWKKRLEEERKPGRDHKGPWDIILEAQKQGFLLEEKAE